MSNQEITIVISLFSLGFFGGLTHCAGMCGPFVLSQVNKRLSDIKIEEINNFKRLRGFALIPYHAGRITTYCFIGGISSFLTSSLKEIAGFKLLSAFLLILAAIVFFFMIFNFSPFGKVNLKISIKKNNQLVKTLQKLIDFLFLNPYKLRGYFLGIILGFIPCGLLYGAIIAVSTIDNQLIAIIAMLSFGIATIPSLFITGYTGYFLFNSFKNKLKLFSKIILLINSFTLLIMAIGLIFNKI